MGTHKTEATPVSGPHPHSKVSALREHPCHPSHPLAALARVRVRGPECRTSRSEEVRIPATAPIRSSAFVTAFLQGYLSARGRKGKSEGGGVQGKTLLLKWNSYMCCTPLKTSRCSREIRCREVLKGEDTLRQGSAHSKLLFSWVCMAFSVSLSAGQPAS